MSWLKIDDRALDDPKLVDLSDAAWRAVVRSWMYAARHETDGYLPSAVADDLTRHRHRVLVEILEAPLGALWIPNGRGYGIHNFTKYNPTKAELDESRAQAAERQRRRRITHERQRT